MSTTDFEEFHANQARTMSEIEHWKCIMKLIKDTIKTEPWEKCCPFQAKTIFKEHEERLEKLGYTIEHRNEITCVKW